MTAIYLGYYFDEALFQVSNDTKIQFIPTEEQNKLLRHIKIGSLVKLKGLIPINGYEPVIPVLDVDRDDFHATIKKL